MSSHYSSSKRSYSSHGIHRGLSVRPSFYLLMKACGVHLERLTSLGPLRTVFERTLLNSRVENYSCKHMSKHTSKEVGWCSGKVSLFNQRRKRGRVKLCSAGSRNKQCYELSCQPFFLLSWSTPLLFRVQLNCYLITKWFDPGH